MQNPTNNYLFNFASSFSGGGRQILLSYLEFFDTHGGAHFIVNKSLGRDVEEKYKNNKFYFVSPTSFQRFFNDGFYLEKILKSQNFDLFFSYGIPIYKRAGKKNWLHISNLIPMAPSIKFLNTIGMFKMYLLRRRLIKYSQNVDVLSADSQYALDLSEEQLGLTGRIKKKVLKNGMSGNLLEQEVKNRERVAITIGTQPYKDLITLYKVFKKLKDEGVVDSLLVVGDKGRIPKEMLESPDVIAKGIVSHEDVTELLASSKVYISTSLIENSSVASLEGAFLCEECILSDIGPHREMLEDLGLEEKRLKISEELEVLHIKEAVDKSHILKNDWNKLNLDLYDFIKANV